MTSTTLIFSNPGEIDIRGATIAGMSAKESKSPIGKFGTGLKYSIACILRWGGSIVIWSGETPYHFTAEGVEFRGQQFQQIHMNGQPIGFTTEYGKQWEGWQVFRELYANALDEGGEVHRGSSSTSPAAGSTIIAVDCDLLQESFDQRNSIILPTSTDYDVVGDEGMILSRPSQYLYYRGVRVRNTQSRLTWNILSEQRLSEDRDLPYVWTYMRNAGELLQASKDKRLIRLALDAPSDYFEHELSFDAWNPTSEEFVEVADELFRQNCIKHRRLRDVLRSKRPDALQAADIKLSKLQEKMLERAKRLVSMMGYDTDGVVIRVVDLGKDTLGCMTEGEVHLSPLLFKQGTKQLVSTLYEEMLHLRTGMSDCTYQMQTHLFNTIVDLYEEHVFGEPC